MAISSLGAAAFVWKVIDYTQKFFQIKKEAVTVLVIGAAGEIGYAIVPMIASGAMFFANQPVILHMLVTDDKEKKRVEMELIDAAFPLLKRVVVTTVAEEACTGVHVAIIIVPRTEGEKSKEGKKTKDVKKSKDVELENSIIKKQAEALKNYAAGNCKVLVVANPANTIEPDWIKPSDKIPEKNITYLTRLEHNRALGQISVRVKVPVSDVKNVIIRGKINETLYANVDHAIVTTSSGQKHAKEVRVADDNWSQFINTVQQRISDRNGSGAMSIAKSACDHVRDWLLGTPKGTWVSMGVYTDGSYGTKRGEIWSFPVKCEKGEWSVEQVC